MAILNIKNFPDELYDELKDLAAREQRSVSQQVVHLLKRAVEGPAQTSVLELRGLGRSLFEDVDAAQHVESERRSWD